MITVWVESHSKPDKQCHIQHSIHNKSKNLFTGAK